MIIQIDENDGFLSKMFANTINNYVENYINKINVTAIGQKINDYWSKLDKNEKEEIEKSIIQTIEKIENIGSVKKFRNDVTFKIGAFSAFCGAIGAIIILSLAFIIYVFCIKKCQKNRISNSYSNSCDLENVKMIASS